MFRSQLSVDKSGVVEKNSEKIPDSTDFFKERKSFPPLPVKPSENNAGVVELTINRSSKLCIESEQETPLIFGKVITNPQQKWCELSDDELAKQMAERRAKNLKAEQELEQKREEIRRKEHEKEEEEEALARAVEEALAPKKPPAKKEAPAKTKKAAVTSAKSIEAEAAKKSTQPEKKDAIGATKKEKKTPASPQTEQDQSQWVERESVLKEKIESLEMEKELLVKDHGKQIIGTEQLSPRESILIKKISNLEREKEDLLKGSSNKIDNNVNHSVASNKSGDYTQRELEFMKKISLLEQDKERVSRENAKRYNELTDQLMRNKNDMREMESKVEALHEEVNEKQRAIRNGAMNSENSDRRDELLTKAKALLFEQTKVSKNQEMQITALTTQLTSFKEVLSVTREMLEIRNTEVETLKNRLVAVETRLREERELMDRRYQISDQMYKQLRQEHDTQTSLFKELKAGYQKKVEILSHQLSNNK